MKKLIITAFSFLLFASVGWAQGDSGSDGVFIDQIGERQTIVQHRVRENSVSLVQAGTHNTVDVEQTEGPRGANQGMIQQYGSHQRVMLDQSGSNNRADFMQTYKGNQIDVTVIGNNISSRVYQFGRRNHVKQELGANNENYTVIQRGNGWKFEDTGFNPNNPGYVIRQGGMVGFPVTITHH